MGKLVIIDISSFIFRAFFAIRPMHNPQGTPINAVYGILTMLLKLWDKERPTHVVLARDPKGGSFRHQIYPEYKATRGAAPDDLIPQFTLIQELIELMKIPSQECLNFEADDVIGSLVTQLKDKFEEVIIVSSDKDLMQFIDGNVVMLDTMKDKIYRRADVLEKMGVYPEQIVDYLSLIGDTSDNIPGVKGIGVKGAAKLLEEYGTLEKILNHCDEIQNKRTSEALKAGREKALLSKQLVTIKTDLQLDFNSHHLEYTFKPNDQFMAFCERHNFKSILAKFSGEVDQTKKTEFNDKFLVIQNERDKDVFLKECQALDQIYMEFFYLDDYLDKNFLAIGIGTPNKLGIFKNQSNRLIDWALEFLALDLIVATPSVKIPAMLAYTQKRPLNCHLIDLIQGHFVLSPEKQHTLKVMAEEFLQIKIMDIQELRKINDETEFHIQFSQRLYAGIRIYPWILKKLAGNDVFFQIDNPLQKILAELEVEGINLDINYYKELEVDFENQLKSIEEMVYEMNHKTPLNLKSPKQVAQLLFEECQLPALKKTKTGFSTDSQVLEQLANMENAHPIPALILKYREIDKLNSTYVKVLPELIKADGKIHTHFQQHVAQTGRLSSDRPNLQNIPIKTENGRKLRKGFYADSGHQFLSADYSQVELRLLAHFSEDPIMLDAFLKDQDIHAQTASEIFHIGLNQVTPKERSTAKAINFGLMYGQSSFGLSQMLHISQKEARDYITTYFTRFSQVKAYLDSLIEKCERDGFSETAFGRRRYIPDIHSTNRQIKSAAERMAINTPIQGTAADIIKVAMIDLHQYLGENHFRSKIILQVHDELILQVPMDEITQMQEIVKMKMQNAIKLKIPLKVDISLGHNWYDL